MIVVSDKMGFHGKGATLRGTLPDIINDFTCATVLITSHVINHMPEIKPAVNKIMLKIVEAATNANTVEELRENMRKIDGENFLTDCLISLAESKDIERAENARIILEKFGVNPEEVQDNDICK